MRRLGSPRCGVGACGGLGAPFLVSQHDSLMHWLKQQVLHHMGGDQINSDSDGCLEWLISDAWISASLESLVDPKLQLEVIHGTGKY